MKEIWKDVSNYIGKYQVSNLGRIKSLARYSWNRYKYWLQPEKILKPSIQKGGYLYVSLHDGQGNAKKFRIHRLVAQAFIPNPNNLPQINHKDENPSNNCVDNLEWCSVDYNINYGHRTQRQSLTWKHSRHCYETAVRNGQKMSKKIKQYSLSGKFIQAWSSMSEASRNIPNVRVGGIPDRCHNKIKYHAGYKWRFS